MLGYVKIDRGELKVREYEVYCGYYCGVCKSIGKRYGQLPRMALSYDAAFLAIMLASLDDAPDAPVQEHCIGHHIKKKTIIRNESIDYAADVMLILAWHKLLDDARDENKLAAKAAAGLLKGIYKKLCAKHPALCEKIEEHLSELTALEKEKCAQLDMAAEAFAKIMETIFSEGAHLLSEKAVSANHTAISGNNRVDAKPSAAVGRAGNSGGGAESDATVNRTGNSDDHAKPGAAANHLGNSGDGTVSQSGIAGEAHPVGAPRTCGTAGGFDENLQKEPQTQGAFLTIGEIPPDISPQEALAKIGYHMGKWIYLIDAADDIEENIQSGTYNPLLQRFGYDAKSETPQAFRKRIEEDLRFNLYHYLAMASNYMNPLDIRKNQGIIENIVYFGLNRKTEEIITRTEPKERI